MTSSSEVPGALLPERVRRWLADDSGATWFFRQAEIDKICAHDHGCSSLPHLWLPRVGGRSDVTELRDCHDCGLTFLGEGLRILEAPLDDEAVFIVLCDCCMRGRQANP